MSEYFRNWLSDVSPSKPTIFEGPVTTRRRASMVEFDSSTLALKVEGEPLGFPPEPLSAGPGAAPGGLPFADHGEQPLTKFFVHVNNYCNLRCTYCYENDLPYDQIKDRTLKDSRIDEVCRFIARSAQGRSDVRITLFGGEPLLSFRQVIALQKELETVLGEGKFKTSLVTNGTIMTDDHVAFIKDKDVDVMVSFDGTREFHEHQRPGPGGSSNYDLVVENIERLVEAKARKVSIRITYGQDSLDLLASIKAVAALGVHDMAFRPIMGGAPVNQWDEYDVHASSLRAVVDFYFGQLAQRDPVIINNVHEVVRRILLQIPKSDYCDWGRICSITPDGEVYPCTHFVGMPEFKMGTAREGSINRRLQAELLLATKIENLPCNQCSVKYLCGGGCRGCSHYVNADIFREDDYCEARREIVFAVVTNMVQLWQDGDWPSASPYLRSLMAEGGKKHSCDRFS